MYNEDIKMKFIDEYTIKPSVKTACKGIFNSFEKHENDYGMDLCEMSTEQLQPIVSSMLGVRSGGHYMITSVLKAYVKWCIANGIHNACDGMLSVTDDNLERIRTQMVNSPLHLQRYLDALYYSEDEKTVDDTFRCFFWLAFGGCDEYDIIDVLDSNVDFENMIVKIAEDKEYPIYREGLRAFRNCVNLSSFVYKHPNYSKDILRDRIEGHQLIRGIKTKPNVRYIRAQISERARKAIASGKTNSSLSYYRVWLSGIFYRMYQYEMAGFDPDFSWLAAKFIEGKNYKLDSGRNLIGAKYRRVLKEYEEDYERWKSAFIK